MTHQGKAAVAILFLASASAAGCAKDRLQEDFGESVRQMVRAQSYGDPADPDAMAPLEGSRAGVVMEEHRRPPAPTMEAPVNHINISVGSGG